MTDKRLGTLVVGTSFPFVVPAQAGIQVTFA
jgi:hypothetical protein